jgi:Tfp pilus assembly protein PilF
MGPTVDTMLGRGRVAAEAGRWGEARRLFQMAAVETAPLLRDRARATDARRWCSIAGMRLGDWTAASADARTALRSARELADLGREARSLNVAGAVEFERGNWPAALDLFSKARLLARIAGDRPLQARIDNNEGSLWAARGFPARARRLYASALAGFQANREAAHAARVMNNLGLSILQEGGATEADEWLQRATAAARGLGDKDLLLTVLINAARAAAEVGDLSRARVRVAEARVLAERMEGDPALADLACALATIARIERRWASADEWIRTALEASKEGQNPLAAADALEQSARVRLDRGEFGKAARKIERARAAYEALGADGAVERLNRLASLLPMGQP